MTERSTLQVKFSNLLQTNPQSCLYGIDLTYTSNLQQGNILFQKIRRKSISYGPMRQKKHIESFNCDQQKQKIKSLINRSKINRLLLEANFEKDKNNSFAGKKKMYVIRRRQQKTRTQDKIIKEQKLKQTNEQFKVSQRSRTQPIQLQKGQEIFKIKRKVPKFGIEDIAPKISFRKKSLGCQKTTGLFMSTSSNNFYNTSFYMNSKVKQFQYTRLQSKTKGKNFTPAIRGIQPHPLNNEPVLERKKQIQRFYTTNFGDFTFTRSKTEQFEPNYLCAWEKEDNYENYAEDAL